MHYSKIQIIFALLGTLIVLYSINIFLTKNIFNTLIGTPVQISFMVLEPPKDICQDCFDPKRVIKMINTAHSVKYNISTISYSNAFSKNYIKKYDIKNLPALIVSGDIDNKKVLSAWKALSGKKTGERIIIENLLPNYDIKSGEIKGIVNATLLKDDLCTKCFNVNNYINIVERLGMFIGSKKVYDVSSVEGKRIVQRYNIKKVPTIILSADAGDYPSFVALWKEVGTITKNGRFIFREVQKLSPSYKKI